MDLVTQQKDNASTRPSSNYGNTFEAIVFLFQLWKSFNTKGIKHSFIPASVLVSSKAVLLISTQGHAPSLKVCVIASSHSLTRPVDRFSWHSSRRPSGSWKEREVFAGVWPETVNSHGGWGRGDSSPAAWSWPSRPHLASAGNVRDVEWSPQGGEIS